MTAVRLLAALVALSVLTVTILSLTVDGRSTSPPDDPPAAAMTLVATVNPPAPVQIVIREPGSPTPAISPSPVENEVPVLLPTVTPTPAAPPIARQAALTGMAHEWQTWNNCGPATMAMALSYHGSSLDQANIASVLRANSEDKNVSPEELAAFARSQGLEAVTRSGGDPLVLKRLLNGGVPVIVEVWLEPEPNDGFGHYRLVTGYDDDAQQWIAYDSYVADGLVAGDGPYAGIAVPYDLLERQWRMFNRVFVVIYPPEQSHIVGSALGDLSDDEFMWSRALAQAQRELEVNPNDPIAWFNQGSALVGLRRYAEAAEAYDRAIAIGLPWRMLWYQFGPAVAYYEVARHEELISLVKATMATTGDVEELFYWYGLGLAALNDKEGAYQAWISAISLRPDYPEALQAMATLRPQ